MTRYQLLCARLALSVAVSVGDSLRTTDARLLQNVTEGEWVKVDFTYDGDKNMLNSIEPAGPDEPLGAIPDAARTAFRHP